MASSEFDDDSIPVQTSFPDRLKLALLCLLAFLAIGTPTLLARNVSPSATFFNQALALGGWGVFLSCLFANSRWMAVSGVLPAVAALGLMAFGVLMSCVLERLPLSLAMSSLGLLFAAALTLAGGFVVSRGTQRQAVFLAVCLALLVAGLVNVGLATVQTFMPSWAGSDWIASPGAQGRAGGNLRQPNHLSSFLLWSIVGLVWLCDTLLEKAERHGRVLWRVVAMLALAVLVFGDVLTVSRTGTVCVVMLVLWAIIDRRLSLFSRVLLWLVPVVYVASWIGMSLWADATSQTFIGGTQLHKADPSSSRFGIWANALSLLREQPWLGVGWGEFNIAWSLTPFPGRPVAFYDHTHNLPLQLLVELGLPLGLLAMGLLAWALWKGLRASMLAADADVTMVRATFLMVLIMVIHSMLEYPLWYAYFLLPTAFALGLCLGCSTPSDESTPAATPGSSRMRHALIIASSLLMAGTAFSLFDYLRVTRIFSVDDDSTPLSRRIAQGQKSIFFAHHADYAAATVATRPSTAWKAFRRAPHLLLDTRLMMAWATAYAEKGDVERARYIADRLREFRNPDSAEFFALCDKPRPPGIPEPFQCKPATRQFTYEDFKLR
ncbi:MAG: O-antigen ligase C-terminal domain-containing protein [Rhizobacter sp.]|nr:O-antigen ligase C-terminal domain-containing protein [Rhizobacter sp.]